MRTDSTKSARTWKGGDLSRFAGKPVRFRFNLHTATLFSFWVSQKPTGESGGYVAAGGLDYKGLKDEWRTGGMPVVLRTTSGASRSISRGSLFG